jgi:hypothetical protein
MKSGHATDLSQRGQIPGDGSESDFLASVLVDVGRTGHKHPGYDVPSQVLFPHEFQVARHSTANAISVKKMLFVDDAEVAF